MFIEFFLRKISIWQKIHFLNKNEYISALKNIYSSYCLFGIYMDKHYTYFNFFDRPFFVFCSFYIFVFLHCGHWHIFYENCCYSLHSEV